MLEKLKGQWSLKEKKWLISWNWEMAEPGGLLSMGLHRVGHDWSNLAAAATWGYPECKQPAFCCKSGQDWSTRRWRMHFKLTRLIPLLFTRKLSLVENQVLLGVCTPLAPHWCHHSLQLVPLICPLAPLQSVLYPVASVIILKYNLIPSNPPYRVGRFQALYYDVKGPLWCSHTHPASPLPTPCFILYPPALGWPLRYPGANP